MKVVINQSFGDFRLSSSAITKIIDKKINKILNNDEFKKEKWLNYHGIYDAIDYYFNMLGAFDSSSQKLIRNDSELIEVVEELAEKAFGTGSILKVVEIPDNVDWIIIHNDGMEYINYVK